MRLKYFYVTANVTLQIRLSSLGYDGNRITFQIRGLFNISQKAKSEEFQRGLKLKPNQ